ncbi:hypothetical protein GCK32_012677 [Trichostrongylus colubriformis]|uniref:Uncharacterized protein n=1 Tax=Trichostrongylus colubriformis TaxID=6319 RepID=A0AAN8F1Y0_TRICO
MTRTDMDECDSVEIDSPVEEVSEYEPDSNELEWSSEEDCVGETNPKAHKKYFMVEGSMLMKLFRYCPRDPPTIGSKRRN